MKLLRKIGLIIVIVALIGYFGFNSIISNVVEKTASKALGVPVSIGFLHLSPFSGKASVTSLSVANPEGYQSKEFAKIGDIDVAVDPKTLFGKEAIVIDHIYITAPELNYELQKKTNIQAIKENAVGAAASPEGQKEKKEGRKVAIGELKINDATVTPYLGDAGAALGTIQLADIDLKNIGTKEKPLSTLEAVQFVFNTISKNINATVGTDPQAILNKVKAQADAKVGEAKEKAEEVKTQADAIKKEADKVSDSLKGLLGKEE